MANSKRSLVKRIFLWLALIIIALLVVFGLIALHKFDSKPIQTGNDSGLYLDPQASPIPLNDSTGVPRGPTPSPTSTPAEQPTPAASPTPTPATDTTTYSDSALHFSVVIPKDWKNTKSSDEVIFTTPQKTQFSIQVYPVTGNGMDALRNFLAEQSAVKNVSAATFAGNQALQFDISGAFGHGFAFLYNGRLYYILGRGVENSEIASSFKGI